MPTAPRIAREIGSSPAFNDWHAEEALPGSDVQDTAHLRDYLRRDTDPYHHPVGTCRIGIDPAAVLDPQRRVHGVDRLRVADASLIPTIPGANTHAAVLRASQRLSACRAASSTPFVIDHGRRQDARSAAMGGSLSPPGRCPCRTEQGDLCASASRRR